MLTPNELLHISEGAEEIAEALHQDILNRIIDRIMIRLGRGDDYILTAIDKWQIQLLQDAGYLLEDIQQEIAKRTPYLRQEIAEAMEDAGVRAISYDNKIYEAAGLHPSPIEESPALIRIMQRNYEATLGEMTNFTGTLAQAAQQNYIQACDKAYNQVLSGSIGYTQAVREAVAELVSDGVTVTYPSGHTDTIETATLRAVRTGVSQASAQIQTARMDEMGVDLVLVSSHLGARPEHALWQGKVYSRSGSSGKYPDFVSSTGYGTVTGLCGANCRHNFSPYFEGMENPFEQYDSEENQKAYELQQRQRTLERRIRRTKREVMGLNEARNQDGGEVLEGDYQRKAALLQKQNAAYNQFCEENGLKKLPDRISTAKWDRSQAAQARAAARRRLKEVGEDAATQNWHSIPVAGGKTDTKYRMITEPKSIDENTSLVNPAYGSKKPGYRQNCQRCVPAYEMRRRGYDVIAKPARVNESGVLSPSDDLFSKWTQVFRGARFYHCAGEDGGKAEIIRRMNEWGDGTVAEIKVQWDATSAHVFVAEKVDGTIRFVDPQTGNTDCENYFTNVQPNATMIARIDNLEPTELIEKCIKNRGGKQ